ncbi:hypothetical protein BDQ17DRAFT_1266641 [Cyathus striatus]|nr:hypothetical protein BDQ17DRAFT_1266641 [Cyathus striatus]
MALIRALPEEYSSFVSALLMKDKLDKEVIHAAFIVEEQNRTARSPDTSNVNGALAASTSSRSGLQKCDFCSRTGHTIANCHTFRKAQKVAQDRANKSTTSTLSPVSSSSSASTAQSSSSEVTAASAGVKVGSEFDRDATEFAGNASTRSLDPSDPSYPLQLDADFDWNTDTGASCHMTPHRHWVAIMHPRRFQSS